MALYCTMWPVQKKKGGGWWIWGERNSQQVHPLLHGLISPKRSCNASGLATPMYP